MVGDATKTTIRQQMLTEKRQMKDCRQMDLFLIFLKYEDEEMSPNSLTIFREKERPEERKRNREKKKTKFCHSQF